MDNTNSNNFYTVAGLIVCNTAFREKLEKNFEAVLAEYDLKADDIKAIKRILKREDLLEKLHVINKEINDRINERDEILKKIDDFPVDIAPRGQRSGWMGSGDAGPDVNR